MQELLSYLGETSLVCPHLMCNCVRHWALAQFVLLPDLAKYLRETKKALLLSV